MHNKQWTIELKRLEDAAQTMDERAWLEMLSNMLTECAEAENEIAALREALATKRALIAQAVQTRSIARLQALVAEKEKRAER